MAKLCMATPDVSEDGVAEQQEARRSSWTGASTSIAAPSAGAGAAAAAAAAKGLDTGEHKGWGSSALAQRTESYQPGTAGVWQILWHGAEATNRITFEGTQET
jgi:hypothetical protein